MVSKGVEQAAAPLRDYCEPDRAKRDHWFESSKHHQKKRPPEWVVFSFGICLLEPQPVCLIDVPAAHRWGAEPKRALWAMKRGGSVVSKGVEQAAAPLRDYCEPDRAGLLPFICSGQMKVPKGQTTGSSEVLTIKKFILQDELFFLFFVWYNAMS